MEPRALTTITASELRVTYSDTPAFKCDSLSVSGNVIAVVGPNGAGKSTLIKTVLGLLEARSGTISSLYTTGSESINLIPEHHMAFCPENGAVFNDIFVEDYLKFWCRVRRGNPRLYRTNGGTYLEQLELGPLLRKRGVALSKGERRRVQTCVGFLLDPRLFLFDEPFDGLDVQRTHELVSLVRQHTRDTSFVISSHRMDVVERLADIVLVLDAGSVVANGSPNRSAETLAGKSLVIDSLEHTDKLYDLLDKTFPQAVLTERGDRIYVCGSGLEPDSLGKFLSENDIPHLESSMHPPTLVDAMTFYLRNRKSLRTGQ